MRKLVAVIFSLALVLSMGTATFATEIYDGSETDTASVEIFYDLETGYCIKIPEQINLEEESSYTFCASFLNLCETEQIVVRMSGISGGSQIVLTTDTEDLMIVDVRYDGAFIPTDGVVAVFTDSLESDGSLIFMTPMYESVHRVGRYSGTFEFTVSVEERT